MRQYILVISTLGLLSACSSTPKQGEKKAVTHEMTKKYIEHIEAIQASNRKALKQLLCPTSKKTIEKKGWQGLIEYANACLHKKNWQMLEIIAFQLTEESGFSPWGSYYLSLIAEHKKNTEQALWFIDLALKKAPEMGLLVYQKARLQWINKEYEFSAENFMRAVKLNPDLIDSHLFLARLNFRDQDYNEAEKHYEKVLQKDPRHFHALIGLAKLHSQKGNTNKEIHYLEKAQLIKPKDEWVNKQLSKYVAEVQTRNPSNEKGSSGVQP